MLGYFSYIYIYIYIFLDLHAFVETALRQVHKVPGSNRGVIAIDDNVENTILKVGIVLDLGLHVHHSSLEKRHVYILFRDFIEEALDHVLFYSAERHMTGRSQLQSSRRV